MVEYSRTFPLITNNSLSKGIELYPSDVIADIKERDTLSCDMWLGS